MISFQPTEEELAFIEIARDLARQKIRPLIHEKKEITDKYDRVILQMKELGILQLELPEKWGGLELPLVTQVQILQELAYGDLDFVQSLPGAGDAASLFRILPENERSKELREKFLTEEMNTVAYIDIDRSYHSVKTSLHLGVENLRPILNGKTPPVRLGETCNLLIIGLSDSTGNKQLCYVDDPGEYKIPVDNRLGLNHANVAAFHFEEVEIPPEQVIASGKEAEIILAQARARIQILQAAKEIGLARAALDYATEYTATRKAFGRHIAQFQGVSFQIAEMAIEIQAANHLLLVAAVTGDQNISQALPLALRGLNRAHRALRFATDRAVQLLGGHGYIREFPVEKWMRDAQAQVLLYGREKELLHEYGEWLVNNHKEVARL